MNLNDLRESYDWQQAFGCVGEPGQCNSGEAGPVVGSKLKTRKVTLGDVKRIIAVSDGDRDGPDWVGLFELNDGVVLTLRAGCDYTGWDCRSGGHGQIAETEEAAIKLGLSDHERQRLGLIGHGSRGGDG